ncbi:hypothetical protein DW2_02275 [Thioclava atlantica]|uniref:EamA domain-containing protein n=1 Tax=Thioclava atlantica TaxID=1317124 RepID=A0A085U1V0_9RHOB|nr:hypothetical protein DW2_02275 [Thioclava atlantica]
MALPAIKGTARGPAVAPSAHPGSDRPGLGVALMLAAFSMLTLMDAFAKLLGEGYHPLQIVWARFAVNAAVLALIFRTSLTARLRSAQPGMQLGRALFQIGAIVAFFFSLRHVPLATATALGDLNPVLVTLGAALFLGERLGAHRLFGIGAAFAGAMIILRPGLGGVHPAAFLALLAAFSFAGAVLLTRHLRGDAAATSQLWSAFVGLALSSLALPFVWQPVAPADLWIFLALGLAGSLSQFLLIRAFALAEAGTLAPFGYSGLLFASLWGWLMFGQLPDAYTIIGAVVIVGAGLYVWSRERRAARLSQA